MAYCISGGCNGPDPVHGFLQVCGDFIDTDEQYHMFRPESDTADPVTDHIQIDVQYDFIQFYFVISDICFRSKQTTLLTDNCLTKISLVNILLWIVKVSILEKNSFCPRFHQILIVKKFIALPLPLLLSGLSL